MASCKLSTAQFYPVDSAFFDSQQKGYEIHLQSPPAGCPEGILYSRKVKLAVGNTNTLSYDVSSQSPLLVVTSPSFVQNKIITLPSAQQQTSTFPVAAVPQTQPLSETQSETPWGLILIGAALFIAVLAFMVSRRKSRTTVLPPSPYYDPRSGAQQPPYGPQQNSAQGGPYSPQQQGYPLQQQQGGRGGSFLPGLLGGLLGGALLGSFLGSHRDANAQQGDPHAPSDASTPDSFSSDWSDGGGGGGDSGFGSDW